METSCYLRIVWKLPVHITSVAAELPALKKAVSCLPVKPSNRKVKPCAPEVCEWVICYKFTTVPWTWCSLRNAVFSSFLFWRNWSYPVPTTALVVKQNLGECLAPNVRLFIFSLNRNNELLLEFSRYSRFPLPLGNTDPAFGCHAWACTEVYSLIGNQIFRLLLLFLRNAGLLIIITGF